MKTVISIALLLLLAPAAHAQSPCPNEAVGAKIWFHTTRNDKDHDSYGGVSIKTRGDSGDPAFWRVGDGWREGGNTNLANRGFPNIHFDDHSTSGPWPFHAPREGRNWHNKPFVARPWRVAQDVSDTLEGRYRVRDWTQERGNLFQAVKTEKTVMWVILSMIIAVAAFNIISMLVMVVTDKRSDIAILKTMGAKAGTVMRIFIVQGSLIGVIGTMLGVAGGITLAHNISAVVPVLERFFGFSLFPADIYYITELPSDLQKPDVIKFAMMSLGMSLLSTIYPAWRASRTHPAEALRYE